MPKFAQARRLLETLASKEEMWYFSAHHEAVPDLTQKCSIAEADGKLHCVNEGGGRSQAKVLTDGYQLEVNALDWGLEGRIEIDKEGIRIKRANGTKWTHKRPECVPIMS